MTVSSQLEILFGERRPTKWVTGLVMYDAFYAWILDAQHETHAWPPKIA